jgi:nucleotide-binding universal stress UspA family protein
MRRCGDSRGRAGTREYPEDKAERIRNRRGIRETIIDAAAGWHADSIAIGSQGRCGVRRPLLGSVPEFTSRQANCSVEIVRIPVT